MTRSSNDLLYIAQQARIGYEAYSEHAEGKSLVTGDPLPSWDEMKKEVQDAWKCAAEAIIFE